MRVSEYLMHSYRHVLPVYVFSSYIATLIHFMAVLYSFDTYHIHKINIHILKVGGRTNALSHVDGLLIRDVSGHTHTEIICD